MAEKSNQTENVLPDDLLRVPVVQALLAGQPPAVSTPIEAFAKLPEAKLISDNRDALMQAGIGFYRAQDGATGAIFNGQLLPVDQLQAADAAGKLTEVAPPMDAVQQAILASGDAHPVLTHPGVQKPASGPPASTAAPSGGSPPPAPAVAPAPVPPQVLTRRQNAVAQTGPTEGPRPGGGRLLNRAVAPIV